MKKNEAQSVDMGSWEETEKKSCVVKLAKIELIHYKNFINKFNRIGILL